MIAVLTVGVFDLLHDGHLDLFEQMHKLSDGGKLVALVHDDYSTYLNKKQFPFQNLQHRIKNVENFMDVVHSVHDADPSKDIGNYIEVLKQLGYTTIKYMRGDDWVDFPGKQKLEEMGIPIIYKTYTKGVSSTQIKYGIRENRL